MSYNSRQALRASKTKRHHFKSSTPTPAASSCDYKSISRSPPHKWTAEQKITLCILQRFYSLSWHDTKLIFNALFADELLHSNGLSKAALCSMHYQLQRNVFPISGRWMALRHAIEVKAYELNLSLSVKSTTQEVKIPRKFRPSHELSIADPVHFSDSEDTLLGDDYSNHETPTKSGGFLPTSGSLEVPELMTSYRFNRSLDESDRFNVRMPRIVFRAQ